MEAVNRGTSSQCQVKVPPGYNPIFWRRYGRAISKSVAELPRCDLRKLGPPPLQLSPEALERIRKAGQYVKRKSRATRSKKQ